MNRPHVLMVCWGFPPFRGSGVHRPVAMANALAAAARVTVVAAGRECFWLHYGADPALEAQVDPGVEMVRVPFFPEHAYPLVNDWQRRRAEQPKAFHRELTARAALFPERVYPPWLNRAYRAAAAVHQRDPVSAVVASGAPYVDLEAGAWLAADIGAPLFLDDRDSFLADVFSAQPHDRYAERLPYFEAWAQQARELWFVNPVIAQWHRDRFPRAADRIHVVENGWDPGVVPADPARTAGRPLSVGYVGLVPSNFPIGAVLEAWQAVRAGDAALGELRFAGPLGYEVGSRAWEDARRRIADTAAVEWVGHVSRPELASVYDDLDVLLLAKEGGEMVTGGKTYEYTATGLPIAALVDPASDTLRVLGAYPRLHLAPSPDAAGMVAALRAAIADARSDDGTRRAAALRSAADLRRDRVLAPAVARVLESAA